MKGATSQLTTHLAQELATKATCWKITRPDGTVFRFTDHDRDLAVPADGSYLASLSFSRSNISKSALLSVDTLQTKGLIDDAVVSDEALRAGLFNYSKIEIFVVNWADLTMGTLKVSAGRVGEITIKDTFYEAELRGLLQAFSRKILDLFSPTCRADLGDADCAVNLATYTQTGTVETVTDQRTFVAQSGLTGATGWFDHGLLSVTSGANLGLRREVKVWDSSTRQLKLYLTLPFALAPGDTFSVYAGCDKSLSPTGCVKFNNVLNYRGEPYVPGMDDVMKVPGVRA